MPRRPQHNMRDHLDRFTRLVDWMKAIWLVFCLGLFLGEPHSSYAQEVAILKSAEIKAYSEAIDDFKSTLPSSFQVTMEYDLHGDITKGSSLAQRIDASAANIVLAVGLKAALVAKREILDIPVIMCLVMEPEKYGLPIRNMVGLSLKIPFEQQLKPFQILAPQTSRIGVLFDPQKTQAMRDQLEEDAKALGLTLVAQEVHSEQQISSTLNFLKHTVEAIYLLPDSRVFTEHTLDFLISSTLKANIPLIGFTESLVRNGAVRGVYFNYTDLGRHAATLVPTLVMPTSSPLLGMMVPPEVVRQAINVKSARYLGLPVSPEILRSFDEHY